MARLVLQAVRRNTAQEEEVVDAEGLAASSRSGRGAERQRLAGKGLCGPSVTLRGLPATQGAG